MRFLIVDDSKAIQAIVRRALQKAEIPDLDFKAVSDGIEALKVMDSWQPDMVLTDWHMPQMSGIELLKSVRQRGWRDLKVGFITTESAKDNLAEAKRLGAAFVLNKPFKDDELVTLINAAFAGSKAVAETLSVVVEGLDGVSQLVDKALARKVTVFTLPKGEADEIHLPSAVGLYAHPGSGDIRALCLLDHEGIVLVGATAAGLALPEVSKLMGGKDIPDDIWNKMLSVLEMDIPKLFVASDGVRLQLLKTQLLKQKPEQLQEIMKRSPHRSDFSLTRAKLPAGQLTLISK